MAIQMGKVLAFTAVSGMVAGLAACGSGNAAGGEPAKDPAAAGTATAGAKDCCKGKNECKGKGNCKTDANACAGKNECKGKGGCKAADCK